MFRNVGRPKHVRRTHSVYRFAQSSRRPFYCNCRHGNARRTEYYRSSTKHVFVHCTIKLCYRIFYFFCLEIYTHNNNTHRDKNSCDNDIITVINKPSKTEFVEKIKSLIQCGSFFRTNRNFLEKYHTTYFSLSCSTIL